MKKIFLVFLLSILILSACNLPTGKPAADVDAVATRVAATMAASGLTETEIQPTNALPTVALETATLTATATETVTPTPTTSPEDPRLTLGDSDFWFSAATSSDPFGVIKNPYDDDAVTITNQVGGLNFTSKTLNLGKRWRMTSFSPTNFYVEGTFKTVTCAGKDNYGLVMRKPAYESNVGYYVGLSCDGSFIVDRLDTYGNASNLVGWTEDFHIKTGENQENRLGVKVINDSFKIYINGSLVKEFSDNVIADKGYIGAYVSAREKANFSVNLQELLVWFQ